MQCGKPSSCRARISENVLEGLQAVRASAGFQLKVPAASRGAVGKEVCGWRAGMGM